MAAPKATQRLQREHQAIQKEIESGHITDIKVELENGTNLHKWIVKVKGPEKTPYEGGWFEIHLEIPSTYPFKPPVVVLKTKTYHPSVGQQNELCQGAFEKDWSPEIRLEWVISTFKTLLAHPSTEHSINEVVAAQFQKDKDKFEATAAQWTKSYAK